MPDIRSNDLCFAIVLGRWGGFKRLRFKGVRIGALNLGFIGLRWWRGDLPGKIVTEVARLATVYTAKNSSNFYCEVQYSSVRGYEVRIDSWWYPVDVRMEVRRE